MAADTLKREQQTSGALQAPDTLKREQQTSGERRSAAPYLNGGFDIEGNSLRLRGRVR